MVGWIKMPLGREVGLGQGHIVLDGDPVGTQPPTAAPPYFRPMAIVAKRSPISATAELLSVHVTVAVTRSSSDSSGIHYVPPVLQMTSYFCIRFHMAHLIVGNDAGAMLKQVVKICNVFVPGRHAVWLCHHIQYGGEVWCLWLPCWVLMSKVCQ